MPQASDELRSLMKRWFGDPVDDVGPILFLMSRGYRPTSDYHWEPPARFHTVNHAETMCIFFLIEEWDWGGVINWDGAIIMHDTIQLFFLFGNLTPICHGCGHSRNVGVYRCESELAVCPDHCPDHEWYYEPALGQTCLHCGVSRHIAEPDWYIDD